MSTTPTTPTASTSSTSWPRSASRSASSSPRSRSSPAVAGCSAWAAPRQPRASFCSWPGCWSRLDRPRSLAGARAPDEGEALEDLAQLDVEPTRHAKQRDEGRVGDAALQLADGRRFCPHPVGQRLLGQSRPLSQLFDRAPQGGVVGRSRFDLTAGRHGQEQPSRPAALRLGDLSPNTKTVKPTHVPVYRRQILLGYILPNTKGSQGCFPASHGEEEETGMSGPARNRVTTGHPGRLVRSTGTPNDAPALELFMTQLAVRPGGG